MCWGAEETWRFGSESKSPTRLGHLLMGLVWRGNPRRPRVVLAVFHTCQHEGFGLAAAFSHCARGETDGPHSPDN